MSEASMEKAHSKRNVCMLTYIDRCIEEDYESLLVRLRVDT